MSPLEVWWAHLRNTNRKVSHLKIPMKQQHLPPPKELPIIKKKNCKTKSYHLKYQMDK